MLQPITVSELTRKIKTTLQTPELTDVAVEGEVSNFVHHSSGHMYFSLKDTQSRVKAVMFRGRNQHLDFRPKNGDTLIAIGSLGVYEQNGEYQLYVDLLLPQGIGELHLAFEQLKEKLAKEGLFNSENKLALPFLPERVGIITSPSGAAIRDILHVLQRRNPRIQALILPALVQGEGAPASLIEALAKAQDLELDVLILGRGGGSFEELAAFNNEELARAIYSSKLPVVSAVGHETDFTIADFVADLRAPTPSAAAELVMPVQAELLAHILNLEKRLLNLLERRIQSERRYLNKLSQSTVLTRPEQAYNQRRQRIDELWTNLGLYFRHDLALKRERLKSAIGKLETLSPLKTLSRGYAICQDQKGQVIKDAKDLETGEQVEVRLQVGRLLCKVEGRED